MSYLLLISCMSHYRTCCIETNAMLWFCVETLPCSFCHGFSKMFYIFHKMNKLTDL